MSLSRQFFEFTTIDPAGSAEIAEQHTQSETIWEWPCRERFGYPYELSSRVKFQMIKVLSREPERSMLGFSREVARDVTHPLWPSRVPLRINCSAIEDAVGGRALSWDVTVKKQIVSLLERSSALV